MGGEKRPLRKDDVIDGGGPVAERGQVGEVAVLGGEAAALVGELRQRRQERELGNGLVDAVDGQDVAGAHDQFMVNCWPEAKLTSALVARSIGEVTVPLCVVVPDTAVSVVGFVAVVIGMGDEWLSPLV